MPITRGGMAALYDVPMGVELYAMRSPQDLRIENRLQYSLTGQMKQTHRTRFDRAVLSDAAESLGLSSYHVLDPAWMFQTLSPFWHTDTGLAWLQPRVTYAPLPMPDLPDGLVIEPNTVAVRFYWRSTFPATEQTLSFARESVKQIAAKQPVIVLDSGLHLDDHADTVLGTIPNVRWLSQITTLTAENNLAVQAAVLARCVGFAGTYGGMAQLALRYGKPSVSVYTDWQGTALAHKHLSEALSLHLNVPFLCVRLSDGPLLQATLPRFFQR